MYWAINLKHTKADDFTLYSLTKSLLMLLSGLNSYQNTASPFFGHIVSPRLGKIVAPPASVFVKNIRNVAICCVNSLRETNVESLLLILFEWYDPPIPRFVTYNNN